MHLVTFENGRGPRTGVLEDGAVIDIADLLPGWPSTMVALIEKGEEALSTLEAALGQAVERVPVASVKLMAPIPKPSRNILCVGRNYADHVKEIHGEAAAAQQEASDFPILFTKAPACVIGFD